MAELMEQLGAGRGHFNNYLLGAPLSRREKLRCEAAMLARCKGDYEKAYATMEMILNRQISKAGGILSCVSILTGIGVYLHLFLPVVLTLITILLMMTLYYVQWSRPETYSSARGEFESISELCYTRSVTIALGSALTFLSVILLLIHIIPNFAVG